MTPRQHPPFVLVILDGWGLRPERDANAIALAHTPNYTALVERFPHSSLVTSGEAVGLPAGQMGNSEVGHMNIGAGRIVYQDITRIDKSIRDGELFTIPTLGEAITRAADGRHALHLLGLVSDGGVHSHQRHLHALIELAARHKTPRVFVHAVTDGRDTSPIGGVGFLATLERVMSEWKTGRIATVCGRYYAMDRDKRWDRTRRAYEALTLGEGARGTSAREMVEQSYARGVTDEFVEPIVITDPSGSPLATLEDGDSVIFFNFRADRARQLTRALAFTDFDGFERRRFPRVYLTTMTAYDATFKLRVVFPPQTFSGSVADVLQEQGLTNLRLAETEKYAHVTYFFNCGEERPYRGEDRILVPSPKVATYDLQPEMSAFGITDTLVGDVAERRHDAIICNFANADMVGHTGKLDAAIAAVNAVDVCLGRIVDAVGAAGGALIVTADHGNAEQMWDPVANAPHTAHTTNPVPIIVVDLRDATGKAATPPLRDGSLRDVAPTMLGMLGIPGPKEMTGRDLRIL